MDEGKDVLSVDEKRMGEKAPALSWVMLLVTYLASICAPLTQFKIPPLSNWLFANFAPVGLDGATFGLLMSAMAIIGVVMLICGFLIRPGKDSEYQKLREK